MIRQKDRIENPHEIKRRVIKYVFKYPDETFSKSNTSMSLLSWIITHLDSLKKELGIDYTQVNPTYVPTNISNSNMT